MVGVPLIVGTPVWVYGHVGVLGAAEIDGVEGGVMPLRGGSELITGADAFGLSAMNGGLRPPPPSSVEPSGIPAGPTVDPGPIDEASGGDAVADAVQPPDVLPAIPPPSKGAVPDVPVTEPPMPADAPVTGLPMLGDVPVVELPMAADGGVDETPPHVAPSIGEAPDVVGLTPGVASSVAPSSGVPDWRIWNAERRRQAKRREGGGTQGRLRIGRAAAQQNRRRRHRKACHHGLDLIYLGILGYAARRSTLAKK